MAPVASTLAPTQKYPAPQSPAWVVAPSESQYLDGGQSWHSSADASMMAVLMVPMGH